MNEEDSPVLSGPACNPLNVLFNNMFLALIGCRFFG